MDFGFRKGKVAFLIVYHNFFFRVMILVYLQMYRFKIWIPLRFPTNLRVKVCRIKKKHKKNMGIFKIKKIIPLPKELFYILDVIT